MTAKPKRPMTTEELAELLNVAVRTVTQWRYRDPPGGGGYGPPYRRIGYRIVRYYPEDVGPWLQNKHRKRSA